MQKLTLVSVVLAMSLSLSGCDSAEQRAEKHFQSAVELLAAGDLTRARVEFRNVFQLNPTHQLARLTLGEALLAAGDNPGAWQQYLLVAEQDPENATATLELAELALRFQNWDDAERYGRRLLDMDVDPVRRDAVIAVLEYRNAVIAKDAQARRAAAEKVEALVDLGANSIAVRRVLIDWYASQDQQRKALAQTEALIALDPDDVRNYLARLQLLNQLGEDTELSTALRAAVDRFPEDDRLMRTLVAWHLQRGELDELEGFLRERAAVDTAQREPNQLTLISFLRTQRSDQAALDEIDTILATTSNPDIFRSVRAEINYALGEKDAAIAELKAIVGEAEPSDQTRRIKLTLAGMLRRSGEVEASRALVEDVLAEDPKQLTALKLKAADLIDNDNANDAIVLLRVAQDQSPQDASVATLLASAYERNGDRDLMGEMLALAAEYADRAPEETGRLARFLLSRQQYLAAEDALKQSLRKAPDSVDTLALLGQVYLQSEKYTDAQAVESKLRSLGDNKATSQAKALELALLRAQDRTEEIAQMLDSLSAEVSNEVASSLLAAQARLTNKDIDGAAQIVAEALEKNPEDLSLLYASGVVANAAGDTETARGYYRTIVGKAPQATKVWLSLARSFASSGDSAAARAVIDEAIASNPDASNLLLAKAVFLEREADIQGAIAIYEKLYNERTSSVVMANNLASLLSSYSDDPETNERAYRIARRLRGIPQPAFQDTYGWLAFRRGELEDALHHLEPSAAKLIQDPLVQYHLGRVYEALERYSEAATQYEKAIAILGLGKNAAAADVAERLASVRAAAATVPQGPEN